MQRKRLVLSSAAMLSVCALWGCGGGSAPTSAAGGNSLSRAESQLNQISSGQQPTNATTLQSTLDLFTQSLKQNPKDPQALFGQAVCQAGLVAGNIDDTTGGSGVGGTTTVGTTVAGSTAGAAGTGNGSAAAGIVAPAPPGQGGPVQGGPVATVPPPHQLGLVWQLGNGVANPNALLQALAPVADLRYGLLPFNGYRGDNALDRKQFLTTLNTVTQNLQTLEANAAFTTTLTLPGTQNQTVNVGLPEVYLFDAYVNSLRAELALSLAYNRDPDAGPPPPVVLTPIGSSPVITQGINMLDKNQDGKLTPDEYLRPSPYLTLANNGMLKTAQQALVAVADRETKGIQGVFARPSDGSGGFLIPNSASAHAILDTTLTNVVPLIQQAATGPVTLAIPHYGPLPNVPPGQDAIGVPAQPPVGKANAKLTASPKRRHVFQLDAGNAPSIGGITFQPYPLPQPTSEQITFNLAAWFANPPADLKAFAPTYTLDSNGYPDPTKTTYPDPTFGGLFPNGLPSDFLQ